jgi:hypothetical protein
MTNANCIVLLTSAGAKGPTLDATMTTIITIRMANKSSTSSTTTAIAMNKRNKKRSLPERKDKGFKP